MAGVESRIARWQEVWGADMPDWAQDEALLRTVAASEYAAQQLQRQPQIHGLLIAGADWNRYDFAAEFSRWQKEADDAAEAEVLQDFAQRVQPVFELQMRGGRIVGHLPKLVTIRPPGKRVHSARPHTCSAKA